MAENKINQNEEQLQDEQLDEANGGWIQFGLKIEGSPVP